MVLSNAAAARARRQVPALRDALPESGTAAAAGRPLQVTHHVTERAEQASALLRSTAWQPDDLLVVNGGDGSVQQVLTTLITACPAERRPRVACLPGGTTNMTAYDLNRHRRFADCVQTLRAALPAADGAPVAPRPVVRVAAGPRDEARCGLFFGIGTIVRGIEYFHARIRDNGGAHELGAGVALARVLWGIARREPPFAEPLTVDVETTPAADGAFRLPAPVPVRLLLATTLERLFLGIRPYWGSGDRPLRCTLVETHASGFLGRMPRLLRGRPDLQMTPANGYHSARLGELALRFDGSFTLDGELFAGAGDTMRVSATEPVRFLRL